MWLSGSSGGGSATMTSGSARHRDFVRARARTMSSEESGSVSVKSISDRRTKYVSSSDVSISGTAMIVGAGSNHRNLTTSQAFWHCMSLVLGLGTLTIPYTLKKLGWAGLIVLAVIAVLSAHTAKLLCRCIEARTGASALKGRMENYPDIGEAAYGKAGRRLVEWILYVDLVASAALFLVFIATNLKGVFPNAGLGRIGWIVAVSLSLLPTVWLKLEKLSFLSVIGSFIMLALVFTVVYAAFSAAPETLDDNHYDFARMEFDAVGNIIFAFAMHGTLLTIYRDMRQPKDAEKLFNKVYLCGYILKFTVGVTGYYLFAQNTLDQITLNLPIPWLQRFITLAVTAKKWLTYALPLEPVAKAAERGDCFRSGKISALVIPSKLRSVVIRTILVGSTAILAISIPFFGLFQSLVGSLCAGFLVLIFPILFYLKLFKSSMPRREYLFHAFLLGVACLLVGLSAQKSLKMAAAAWISSSPTGDH